MTNNEYYTYITPYVAIGSRSSPHTDFDIIVDLGYINEDVNNGLGHHDIRRTQNGKLVIEVGIYDKTYEKEFMEHILNDIVLKLIEDYKTSKILFKCLAGKSRSVTMVVGYLSLYLNQSVDETIKQIKEKRPDININEGFYEVLLKWCGEFKS